MKIIFDKAKDEANRAKHHCSLALAEAFEWDTALARQDDGYSYGEVRMAAIGWLGDRLYVVVFTDRDEERRIISLRKANKREVRRYYDASI